MRETIDNMAQERISQAEFARRVDADLRRALNKNLLDEHQLRAILAILEPAAERAELRKQFGGPTDTVIETN